MVAKMLVLAAAASVVMGSAQAEVTTVMMILAEDPPPSDGAFASAFQLSESFNSKPDSEGTPFDFTGGGSQADAFGEFDAALARAEGDAYEGVAVADVLTEAFASSGDASSIAESVAQSDEKGVSKAEADSIALTGNAFSEADALGSSSGRFAGSFTKAEAVGGVDATAVANSVTVPFDTLDAGGAFSEAVADALTGDAAAVAESIATADDRAKSDADASAFSRDGDADAVANSVSISDSEAEAEALAESTALGGRATSSAVADASGSGFETVDFGGLSIVLSQSQSGI